MEQPLREALRQAVALLEKHGYRYAVIGGIANQRWGRARLTRDVDLKVLVPDTDYPTCGPSSAPCFQRRPARRFRLTRLS